MAVDTAPQRANAVAPPGWEAPVQAESFAVRAPSGRSRALRKVRRIGWNLLPPLTFLAIVAAWAGAIAVFRIPAYLLPAPGQVFARVISDGAVLWTHSMVTLTEIVFGFGLTVLTAIPLGLVIALSRVARQIVYPPLMLMQLVPKIAVAPLFLVWLGFGIESKVLLTV